MMSYNESLYADVLDYFAVTNTHDRKLIANRLSKAYKNKYCIDNYRICVSDNNKIASEEYIEIEKKGCCGFWDEFIFNEVTGNYYWVGFNYGH